MKDKVSVFLWLLPGIISLLFVHAGFGQEQAVWPISNDTSAFADVATSPFGSRDRDPTFVFKYQFHGGLDLYAWEGRPIHAIFDGEVVYRDFDSRRGNWIAIRVKERSFFV